MAARELVLAYHDVFALESNELGCTSAMEHEIHIKNDEPFKEWFRCIPPPLLEEVRASLRDGSRSDSSEPIPLVQHGHPGPEERWYSAFLHGLKVPQCMNEEGIISLAMDSGGLGKHGGVSAFLTNRLQTRLLADQDGSGIPTVHGLNSG